MNVVGAVEALKTERRPLFVAESGAFVEHGCIKKDSYHEGSYEGWERS
jgi:hypothetical protein